MEKYYPNKYAVVICMPSIMFQKVCDDIRDLGNTLLITVYSKTLEFSCYSDNKLQEPITLELEPTQVLVSLDNVIESKYKLKDVTAFAKYIKYHENIH